MRNSMKNNKWVEDKLRAFQDDLEFQLEEFKLDISEKISEYMLERNMNRKQFAQKLNCSSAYITKLLNGNENLTIAKLFQIARVMETKLHIDFIDNNLECQIFYKYQPKKKINNLH